MIGGAAVADIPRALTAVAEWGACLVFLLILARRMRVVAMVGWCAAGLAALLVVHHIAGGLGVQWWVPGMLAAVAVMYAVLWGGLRTSALTAGYLTARALVLAELVAAFHWQLHIYFFGQTGPLESAGSIALLALYPGVFVLAWAAESRHFPRGQSVEVTPSEVLAAGAIAAVTFFMSNISFLSANTPFSGRLGAEILWIRTLVDLCGYIALYVQQEHRRENQLRAENSAMNSLLRSQHEQYLLTRRTVEEVNRKYHDMKHQIQVIRAETDDERRASYLAELEDSVADYGHQRRTGSPVLDTLLQAKGAHCAEQNIEMTVVADGRLLEFIRVIDVISILGNALDNAIEACTRLPQGEDRRIKLAVFAHGDLLMIRIDNTYDGGINVVEGRPVTRKADRASHGFGLRNIEDAAERYDGTVTFSRDQCWFSLRVLMPLPEDSGRGGEVDVPR